MTRTERPAPSLLTASLRVFELSLGEMLWSRRTIFMGLVVGLPVLLALVVRAFDLAGASGLRVNNMAVDGPAIFGLMIWAFFLKFSVPVLPSIVLVWLLVIPMGGSLGGNFLDLIKDLGIVAMGLAVYGALFAFIGAYFKRPLLIGLVFVFGWEQVALAIGYFALFTVAHYLQGLVPHAMPNDSAVSMMMAMLRETPSLTTSFVGLAVILVGFLTLAARVVARREYVLEQ